MTKTFWLGNGNYSLYYSEFYNDEIIDTTEIGTYVSDVHINGTKDWTNGDLTGVYLRRNLSKPSNVRMIMALADSTNTI